MIRRNVVVPVLALGLALIVAPAHAGGLSFGVNGGMGMPTSDYGQAFKLGWGGGVTADYGLMPLIGVGADLGYQANSAKDEINAADLERYFKQASFKLPKSIKQALPNAAAAGYFDGAGGGRYRLNPVGYNLVVHGLPRGQQIKTSRAKRTKNKARG